MSTFELHRATQRRLLARRKIRLARAEVGGQSRRTCETRIRWVRAEVSPWGSLTPPAIVGGGVSLRAQGYAVALSHPPAGTSCKQAAYSASRACDHYYGSSRTSTWSLHEKAGNAHLMIARSHPATSSQMFSILTQPKCRRARTSHSCKAAELPGDS